MNSTNLVSWLPFDTSTTLDKYGNTWTAHGNASLSTTITKFGGASVHLPSGAYLTADNILGLSVDKWTFDAWAYLVSDVDDDGYFGFAERSGNKRGIIAARDGVWIGSEAGGSWQTENRNLLFPSVKNQWRHLAITKDGMTLKFYENGTLVWSVTITKVFNDSGTFCLGGNNYGYANDIYFDEVRFFAGVVLWGGNFTPPTADDYIALYLAIDGQVALSFGVDVKCKIRQPQLEWRYENAGNDSIVSSTNLDVDNTKSVTGYAFHGGSTQADCFNTPAGLKEVWFKFDLYLDSAMARGNRFSFGHHAANGYVGVWNGNGYFGDWNAPNKFLIDAMQSTANDTNLLSTRGKINHVLLHMVSDATNGIIELNVNGTTYTYTGNVNNGNDFDCLYLYSSSANILYSNVIISNVEIDLGEGYHLISADTLRNIKNIVDVLVDVERTVQQNYSVDYALDVQRDVRHSLELGTDVKCNVTRSWLANLDLTRNVILSVDVIADALRNILANVDFAPTDNSQYFSGVDNQTPVVIPSQPALLPGDTNRAQAFELTISEQQLTDQLKVTSVTPLQLLQRLKGQYLDYQYDMRVERGSKQGIIYSADCFINIDEILYTPLNYDMPAAQVSVWYTENQAYQRQLYPLASQHVIAIANALGLQPVMQFDDFYSLVEVESQKENGGTYADLIREIFGWSSRVPTQLINAYIRDGKLYVIQRGHEAHLIDLTNAKMTMPIVTHELMRTYYQRRKFSKTETREVKRRRINHTNSSTEIHSGGNTISNYGYDNSGLLDHTVTTTTNSDGETVRTETDYDYVTLANGEKVLVKETTKKYVDGSLEEITVTKHTPLKQGLSHQIKLDEDGDIVSEGVGQNSSDDRVTPYSEFRDDPSGEYETYQEYIDIDGFSLIDTSFPIQNVIRENFTNSPYPILGLTEEERMSVDTAKGHGRLKALTEEIKRLNLKTKETVNVTIYDYPHLIDFNDRILFKGNEYFLVSNTSKTIPRLFNSQSLTFVRWF